MKILHVIASVDPRGGGPIEGIFRQVDVRRRMGIDTDVVTLDPPDADWVARSTVKTFALGNPVERGRRPLNYSPALVPWLRSHKDDYDIVVVNGLWNYATLAARRALVGTPTPYVVFTHGMLDPWFKQSAPLKSKVKQLSWWISEGPLLNNARAVLFTSDEERALARGAFWPYRVRERVVGYGTADMSGDAAVQISAFRTRIPALGARSFLLFLSRIHPKKGCDLLIEAFAAVAAEHPDLDLVIAGPDQTGWQRELAALAEARGVAGRIHWPGMLSGDVKWGAYRATEAFVLPSHQENFGIVVAEAMAAGKPVLISNKVNIWREVQAGGGGLVEADDVEGAKAMLRAFLALSPDARSTMGAAARQTFLDRFEMSKVAREIVGVMKEEVVP